jgi:hypothetical protein
MYVPSINFRTEQPVEVVCKTTGESYVWVDLEMEELPPELKPGAVEYLPNRFHQHPHTVRKGENTWKVLFVPQTPEPRSFPRSERRVLAVPEYLI